MKNKILILIIGMLIGAILSAGGFIIYENVKKDNNSPINNEAGQMRDFNRGQMSRPSEMDGTNDNFNGDNKNRRGKGGQRLDVNNSEGDNMGEPPAMPEGTMPDDAEGNDNNGNNGNKRMNKQMKSNSQQTTDSNL